MKKGILILCLFFVGAYSYAQENELSIKNVFRSINISECVFDYLPYQLSYRSIDPNNVLGFQLKVTGGKYQPVYTGVNSSNIFQQGGLTVNYLSVAGVIKPGITLINKVNKIGVFYLAASLSLAYSFQTLDMIFQDPIYGKVTSTFQKNVVYSGLEIEGVKIFRLGKHINVNTSLSTGYAMPHQPVFDNIINNLSSNTTYTPGLGFGKVFISVLIGAGYNF